MTAGSGALTPFPPSWPIGPPRDPSTPRLSFSPPYPAPPCVLTCADVHGMAACFAFRLSVKFGSVRDELICNTLYNGPERVVTDMGIVMAGAILMDGHNYNVNECQWRLCDVLAETKCHIMVADGSQTSSGLLWGLNETVQVCWVECRLTKSDGGDQRPLLVDLGEELAERVYYGLPRFHLPHVTDTAVIWRTQHTPNHFAKVVYHSHASVLEVGRQVAGRELLALTPKDVVLVTGGLGRMLGFPLSFLLHGLTTVMEDRLEYGRPQVPWRLLSQYHVTKALMTPADLQQHVLAGTIPSRMGRRQQFQRLVLAGQWVTGDQVREIVDRIAREVAVGYCTTEMGYIAAVLITKRAVRGYPEGRVGRVLEGVGVRLEEEKDSYRGALATGDVSRIYVSNPRLPPRPVVTLWGERRLIEPNTFLDTSDVGVMSGDGMLTLMGSDASRLPMTHVFPEGVELTLKNNVSGIKKVVVVEVTLENAVPAVVAVLTLRPGHLPDPTRRQCLKVATEHLRKEDRPAHYRVFDDLPNTPWGRPCRTLTALMVSKDMTEDHPWAWRWDDRHSIADRGLSPCCAFCVIL